MPVGCSPKPFSDPDWFFEVKWGWIPEVSKLVVIFERCCTRIVLSSLAWSDEIDREFKLPSMGWPRRGPRGRIDDWQTSQSNVDVRPCAQPLARHVPADV